jgi:hypothetical protein
MTSGREGSRPLRVDAVEKVGPVPAARNNGIVGIGFLNRSWEFDARLESMLLGSPFKVLFSTASVKMRRTQ